MISGIDSNMVSTWASSLFTKLDTRNQGYLEKADFQSALSSVSGSSDGASDVEDIFERLDGDSDGKVTENEMATALQNLFSQTTIPFNSIGGPGGPGGPGGTPPPPPKDNDEGFTKDELTGQLEEIGSSDSKRSSLISSIVENFDEADTNEDGKVSFQEAMAYDQANQSADSTQAAPDNAAPVSDTQNSEIMMAQQIMNLLKAYQVFESSSSASESVGLSVSA